MSITLAVFVTMAAFTAVDRCAHALMKAWHPRGARVATSHGRARTLFLIGVGPTMLATGVAFGIVLPAFLLFEPNYASEPHGLLLPILAAAGTWIIAGMVVRGARMLRVSRSLIAAWTRTGIQPAPARWGMPASVVTADFPVVAVSGVFRPHLFIDRRVLEACDARELDAIAAHEWAHVLRHDNLCRLLVGACTGSSSELASAWRQAAEQAADERAARTPRRAVDLASALIKVSRLAPTLAVDAAIMSTIHDGGCLEGRVRSLLDSDRSASRLLPNRTTNTLFTTAALAVIAAAFGPTLFRSVHACIELVVRHLP